MHKKTHSLTQTTSTFRSPPVPPSPRSHRFATTSAPPPSAHPAPPPPRRHHRHRRHSTHPHLLDSRYHHHRRTNSHVQRVVIKRTQPANFLGSIDQSRPGNQSLGQEAPNFLARGFARARACVVSAPSSTARSSHRRTRATARTPTALHRAQFTRTSRHPRRTHRDARRTRSIHTRSIPPHDVRTHLKDDDDAQHRRERAHRARRALEHTKQISCDATARRASREHHRARRGWR